MIGGGPVYLSPNTQSLILETSKKEPLAASTYSISTNIKQGSIMLYLIQPTVPPTLTEPNEEHCSWRGFHKGWAVRQNVVPTLKCGKFWLEMKVSNALCCCEVQKIKAFCLRRKKRNYFCWEAYIKWLLVVGSKIKVLIETPPSSAWALSSPVACLLYRASI